jgi:chitinase
MSATRKEIKVTHITRLNADDTNVYVKFAVKIREKAGGAVLYTLDGSARGDFRLGNVTSDKVCIAAPSGSYTALTVTSMDIPRVSGQEADLARRAIAANFPPNVCVPLYPTITIADAHGEECVCPPGKDFLRGNIARFRVTLSNLSARTVTVRYATADGSAKAGTDYSAASGNLNIPTLSSYGEIHVALSCRKGTQGNRRFTVTLSNAVNGVLIRNQAQGLIIDYPEGEPCGP